MRVLAPHLVAAASQRRLRFAVCVEAEFPSGPVYFNDSPQTFDYLGKTYLGGGRLLGIKFAREDSSLGAHKAEITLDGLDAAAISLAFNEPTENAPVVVRVIMFNPDTGVDLGDFVLSRYTVSEVRVIPPSSAEGT
jgi:hypothetical protein